MNKVNIRFNAAICKIEGLNSDIVEAIKYRLKVEITEERYQDYKNKTRLPITKEGANYYLVEEFDKYIQIPTGLLLKLVNYLKTIKVEYTLHKQILIASLNRKPYVSLREEQQLAINKFLTNKRGIIKAPTSWGKSILIAELCRQFDNSTKILILVPTVLLLYQMQQDIANYISMVKENIGLIGDGNFSINQITVAIPDTLAIRLQNLDSEVVSYLQSVNVVTFDEAHTMLTPTVFTIGDYLTNTEYRFGLSATPILDNFSEGLIGSKLHEFAIKDSMKRGDIMTPKIVFHTVKEEVELSTKLVNFKFEKFEPKEMKIYNTLYDKVICQNSYRNSLAATQVEQDLSEGRIVLVLVKKVATSGGVVNHAEIIQKELAAKGIYFDILHGKSKNKEQFKEDLANEKIKGLIASVGILSEGVSINSISSLILLSAGSKDKDFVQRAGRALRLGKLQPKIHDFMDCQSVFINQSKARLACAIEEYGSENVKVL
jgi:superfamily II DNA or RNA helicase